MRNWVTGLAIAAACLLTSWALLVLLARRLPPGLPRDLAAFITDCVTTVRLLCKAPRAATSKDRHRDRRPLVPDWTDRWIWRGSVGWPSCSVTGNVEVDHGPAWLLRRRGGVGARQCAE
jgi:hypothetical protein